MRHILLAGKEAHERPALVRDLVTQGPAQRWIAGLERVEHRAQCCLAVDFERHLATGMRKRPQMRRKYDPDHDSVWTSTESTAGRSRTMGAQLSPASGDKYTCPPVVPK
jgi:hypothetical protein